ncbi:hypothetical protein DQ226_11620 [Dietzia maris]|uniref:DUF4868 domain-containing protein n=1 Tax=Dietzia maris TaxID=37915 RepID=A0A365P9G1_9ACTN|nr:Kiwa anti-phage protein KwaB-like domain-containing protein [Dietzia sp. KRD202]RBA33799.1 hypothetical protein DQ226_11620 [Dietzia maris]
MTGDDVPITTEGALQLIVAWASGKQSIGRLVKTGNEVEESLRSHATSAVESLTDPAPYSPETDLEDNTHLVANTEELLDTSLVEELFKGASLPLATQDELRTKTLLCHAALIGNGTNSALFVKKRSPIQLAKKSMVAQLVNGTLDQISSPIFAFDNKYDAIITTNQVYILNKTAFEGLFRDSAAVLSRTRDWVDEVSTSVPMTEGSADVLDQTLRRNQFLRRKFLAVKGRPHIRTMTPDSLREEIRRHGYDPAEMMNEDRLTINGTNVKLVLQILNEDLFSGGFSSDRFAAGSKRSVQ